MRDQDIQRCRRRKRRDYYAYLQSTLVYASFLQILAGLTGKVQ